MKLKEDTLHLGEGFLGLLASPSFLQNVNIANAYEEYLSLELSLSWKQGEMKEEFTTG